MYFLILRGLPASGKSTWVRNMGLSQYVVSSDTVRLMCGGATFNAHGWVDISQSRQAAVWEVVSKIVELRLRRRMFTILDSTCIRLRDLRSWIKMAQSFGVTPVVVDFTTVPVESCMERDQARISKGEYFVGRSVMDRMVTRLEASRIDVALYLEKERVSVLSPSDASKALARMTGPRLAVNQFRAVYFIGDIHGCYSALCGLFREWGLDMFNLPSDCLFVFLGDYLDRGLENGKVLRYIHSICQLPNVMLLEGNHELHWRSWFRGEDLHEVFQETLLECHDTLGERNTRAYIRDILPRLVPCYELVHSSGLSVLVSHGGVPFVYCGQAPTGLIAGEDYIRGIGNYEDAAMVAEQYDRMVRTQYAGAPWYQVFGHRNVRCAPIEFSRNCFNLCDQVEHGGYLRGLHLNLLSGVFTPLKVRNAVFKHGKFDVKD